MSNKTWFLAGAALAVLAVAAIGYAQAQNATDNDTTTTDGGSLPASGGHTAGHDCPLHHHKASASSSTADSAASDPSGGAAPTASA